MATLKLNGYAPWLMLILVLVTTAGAFIMKTGGVKERINNNSSRIAVNTADIKELNKNFNDTVKQISVALGKIEQAVGVK